MYGLSNLTNLMQTKNTQDSINYIFLLTAVLNRLSLDQQEAFMKPQTQIRAALISAVCKLDATNQVLIYLFYWSQWPIRRSPGDCLSWNTAM